MDYAKVCGIIESASHQAHVSAPPQPSTNPSIDGAKDSRSEKRSSTSSRVISTDQARQDPERAQVTVEHFLRSSVKRAGKGAFAKKGKSKGKASYNKNATPSKFPSSPIEILEGTGPSTSTLKPAKENAGGEHDFGSPHAEESPTGDREPGPPSLPEIAVLDDSCSEEDDLELPIRPRSKGKRRQIVRDSDSESGDDGPPPDRSPSQPQRPRVACTRRIIRDSELDSTISEDDSDFGKMTPPVASRAKYKQKGPLKTKSLGTRLFDASVATHGNPLDSLVVPPLAKSTGQTSTRRPLEFRPIDDNGPSQASSSRRPNPSRQTEPSRDTAFSSRPKGKIRTVNLAHGQPMSSYKPVSSWRPTLDPALQHAQPTPTVKRGQRTSRGQDRKVASGTPAVVGVYPPIQFQPVSETQVQRGPRKKATQRSQLRK
jgi:hypothetical protein